LTVARLGPIRLSELAAAEGLNPTMLSRLVAELCERGLAKRVSDPRDRRVALVKVTADGRRLRDRIRRERTAAVDVALETMSAADRRSLERALPVLEQLAEHLRDRRS
jgi:DNA-binding MarR family transcriptional regulator